MTACRPCAWNSLTFSSAWSRERKAMQANHSKSWVQSSNCLRIRWADNAVDFPIPSADCTINEPPPMISMLLTAERIFGRYLSLSSTGDASEIGSGKEFSINHTFVSHQGFALFMASNLKPVDPL